MKKINVEYGIDRKIFSISDTAVHYEQENRSLQIDAKIETDKKVRAYIKAANGNSDVTDYIQSVEGVYSVFIEDKYMSKGTLYVGFEICGERGYIERLEPLKVYIDSFVNPGEGNADNVYVVTVEIDEVETLSPDGQAYVENVGNKKDVRLKLGIPQGVKGADGKDGYTPVAGKDYYTDEEKAQFLVEVLSTLPVIEDVPNHESSNLITNGAITRFILEKLSQVTNGYDQNYNPLSKNPQSGVAVAQAVAQKVDKEEGKGLSANDFTDWYVNVVENANAIIDGHENGIVYREDLNVVDEEIESIDNVYIEAEGLDGKFPSNVKLKDTKAREMINNIPMQKIFEVTTTETVDEITDNALENLKLDEIYVHIKLGADLGANSLWYCSINGTTDSKGYLYYFETKTTGKYFMVKSKRMCKNQWFAQKFNNLSSGINNQPLYASYQMAGIDYINSIKIICPGLPAGSTITVCGRKVVY